MLSLKYHLPNKRISNGNQNWFSKSVKDISRRNPSELFINAQILHNLDLIMVTDNCFDKTSEINLTAKIAVEILVSAFLKLWVVASRSSHVGQSVPEIY